MLTARGNGDRPDKPSNDDDAKEQATPERHDPFRAVLAPDNHRIAFAETEMLDAFGETTRGPSHVRVRMGTASKAVVKDQKIPGRSRQIGEKVNERGAGHD